MQRPATQTQILLNLSVPDLAERYAAKSCGGVGLMRAEFLAMTVGVHPQHLIANGGTDAFVDFFASSLQRVAQAFFPRPVVYRTLDLKSNEYAGLEGGAAFEQTASPPLLGSRGCRRYLADPASFRLELQAVRKVMRAGLNNVRLMLPFGRSPDELATCRDMIGDEGLFDVEGFELWMMAEVPSNVLRIEDFLPHVSGVSIGSNDLTQLILGIDRDSHQLAKRFDARDPAVLAAIERIARACRQRRMPVSICGDAPSRHPGLIAQLLEFGLTSISVSADMLETTIAAVADAEARLGIAHSPSDS